MIEYHKSKGLFWFRIFGRGLAFINVNKFRLPFGVRMGLEGHIRIGNWIIEVI